MIGPLVEQAATQAHTTATAEELAATAGQTAYLLGCFARSASNSASLHPTRC